MPFADPRAALDKDRSAIAERLRKLRLERRLNQAELARQLGVSQTRLSEIERGATSLTAEQFLALLRLFNVTVGDFCAPVWTDHDAEVQNVLSRLRALHTRSSDVAPSEQLRRVSHAIREILIAPDDARLVTALAPVLVHNVDVLHLPKLRFDLSGAHLERRLGWLLDNTVAATAAELSRASRAWWRQLRRASATLDCFSQALSTQLPRPDEPPDVLEAELQRGESLEEALAKSSPICRRWRIVSRLESHDFAAALQSSHDGS